MQVLASCSVNPNGISLQKKGLLGRRQLLSSVCCRIPQNDTVSGRPISPVRIVGDWRLDLRELVMKTVPLATRRMLLTSVIMHLCYNPSRYSSGPLPGSAFSVPFPKNSMGFRKILSCNELKGLQSVLVTDGLDYECVGVMALMEIIRHDMTRSITQALGDPSVTVEDVSPPVFPSGPLFPTEERIVQLFEKNTYSVVNIFDVTLRPQLKMTGVVEIPEGNGSGVVWDGRGHIVTNYHVIGNALSRNPKPGEVVARVNILASDGVQKNFVGKLVGADRAKDLAVLKVEAPEDILKPIKVGKSNALKVGQECLAIGNPFGFDHTLTVGVISGLNRDIFSQAGVTIGGGIQTDAAINPGNSGGPLLDSKGNLIGINTAIFTQTGTSAGVGFAIPSSTVLNIVPQLIQFSKVRRAGINVEIAPDLVANQLNVRNGALVLQVLGDSLAAKAGILATSRGFAGNIVLGDIIVAIDDKPVKNKAEMTRILDEYNVGDRVKLKIQRGSEDLDLQIELEEKNS